MKLAIIGAGASGLMLASILKDKYDITIFNSGKIGSKILASGNGRCNISNLNPTKLDYLNQDIPYNTVIKYKDELFNLFKEYKIYTKSDIENRLYPISESSLSVLNALLKEIKAKFIDALITSIIKKNNKFYLNDLYGPFDKIFICTGSIAGKKNKEEELNFYKSLNINLIPLKPTLVGFKIKNNLKSISGVRVKCEVSLINDNKIITKQKGEVIFKDDGISGICIMNLSCYYQMLNKKINPKVVLNLIDKDYDSYITIFNPKLLDYINKYHIDIHKMTLDIKDTYDYSLAQTCLGGVDYNLVNSNLSLKADNNIYILGEALNMVGLCGGFNLMHAFCSAILVSKDFE